MEKTVRKYTRLYQRAIRRRKLYDVPGKTRAYRDKLTELYASELYRQHSACRSMNPPRVYAIIAMILSLQSAGVEQAEIEAMVEETFCKAQKHIRRRTKLLDLYPGAWRIVRKRKIAAHKKHAGDGSMVFDSFEADDECVTYQVHRCMYVEMFAAYGIREYSRIFCKMERAADGFLPNHVWFVPYSDLLTGDCCRVELARIPRAPLTKMDKIRLIIIGWFILTIILMLFGTHSKVMEVIGWLSMAGWAVFHLVKMRCPCCGVPSECSPTIARTAATKLTTTEFQCHPHRVAFFHGKILFAPHTFPRTS